MWVMWAYLLLYRHIWGLSASLPLHVGHVEGIIAYEKNHDKHHPREKTLKITTAVKVTLNGRLHSINIKKG